MVRWGGLAGVVALMLTAYFLVPVRTDPTLGDVARGAGAVALLGAAAAISARQVRRSVSGASARVDGLVLAIVVSVVLFSLVGYGVEVHNPGQFVGLETRLDALYFTLATLLTVGYGDVHAAGQGARALVVVQMVFDVVVVAATASVLSSRVREGIRQRSRDGRPEDPRA